MRLGDGGREVSIDHDSEDRRRSPRASCRLHCRVLAGNERTRARIVDVSNGGLCLLSPTWFASKSKIHISIDVPNRGESIVEAQVWHVRRQKMHGGTRKVWAVGVMLEETDDPYQRLLLAAGVAPEKSELPEAGRPTVKAASASLANSTLSRSHAEEQSDLHSASLPPVQSIPSIPSRSASLKDTLTGSAPQEPRVESEGLAPEDMIEPKIFRIRVKATGGPRTKVLTLTAESEEEARELAVRDLESRWTIMDVRAA